MGSLRYLEDYAANNVRWLSSFCLSAFEGTFGIHMNECNSIKCVFTYMPINIWSIFSSLIMYDKTIIKDSLPKEPWPSWHHAEMDSLLHEIQDIGITTRCIKRLFVVLVSNTLQVKNTRDFCKCITLFYIVLVRYVIEGCVDLEDTHIIAK